MAKSQMCQTKQSSVKKKKMPRTTVKVAIIKKLYTPLMPNEELIAQF
jgi:hypothetical protein